MLDYLGTAGFQRTFDALKEDAGLEDFQPDPKAKWTGLLEKKWTSVIRLQKKVRCPRDRRSAGLTAVCTMQIMELETRNAQLQEELSSAPAKRPSASSPDWVPRAPARHTLTGHRSPVTRVAFHPLFSLLVSASEDTTLKVYDWETGDFERTIKGHTKPVQDVDFDSKGNFLGQCLDGYSWAPCLLTPRHECSFVLIRPDAQTVGHQQRLEEYQDVVRSRSLDLFS